MEYRRVRAAIRLCSIFFFASSDNSADCGVVVLLLLVLLGLSLVAVSLDLSLFKGGSSVCLVLYEADMTYDLAVLIVDCFTMLFTANIIQLLSLCVFVIF